MEYHQIEVADTGMQMKRIEDFKEIYDLLNEFDSSFFSTMKEMNVNNDTWAEKIAKYGMLYVKEVDKTNVGLLIFYANDKKANTSFLSYIVVKEGYQGCHFGDEMIRFWMKQINRVGYKYCRLEVDKRNERAIRFYKKHGFELEESCSDKSYFMRKKVR